MSKRVPELASYDGFWAASVHVSSLFWPLLGPLVGLIVFRKRPFVFSHARQALTETIVLNLALAVALIVSTCYTIFRISQYAQTGWKDFDIREFLLRFLIGWVVLGILQGLNTVVSIRQAWFAFHGKWPRHAERAIAKKASL